MGRVTVGLNPDVGSHHSAPTMLSVRLDPDLNIVARILDLLIVLDAPMPGMSLTTSDDEAMLVLTDVRVSQAKLAVLQRRIAQLTGVRAADADQS